MNEREKIRAVLFDVDGVVVESELLHLATFNELLAPFGIFVTEQDWKTRFLGAGSAHIIETLFLENKIKEDPASWADKRRALYRQYVAAGALKPVSGFLSFYKSVQDANLSIAFVSTGHPLSLMAALRSLNLEGKHPVIDVTHVEKLKPDPEAYLLGAQTLQVPPSHCIVFEDSPIGVAAAKAASMFCVALTTTNPESDLDAADLIISNFEGWNITKILDQVGASL